MSAIIKNNTPSELQVPKIIQLHTYSAYTNLLSINAQTKDEQTKELVTKDILPLGRNQLNMISASGGGFKSFIALRIAMNYTVTEDKKVLCIFTEDSWQQVVNRIHILKKHEETFDDSKLAIMSVESNTPSDISQLVAFIETVSSTIGLIVLDPLLAFYEHDENNNVEAKKFMDKLSRACRKYGVTLLILHHSAKNTSNSRGAGAFTDACRVVYHKAEEENDIGLKQKSNIPVYELYKDNIGIKYLLEKDTFPISILPTESVAKDKGVNNVKFT